jgi:hypothetical protein
MDWDEYPGQIKHPTIARLVVAAPSYLEPQTVRSAQTPPRPQLHHGQADQLDDAPRAGCVAGPGSLSQDGCGPVVVGLLLVLALARLALAGLVAAGFPMLVRLGIPLAGSVWRLGLLDAGGLVAIALIPGTRRPGCRGLAAR